MFRLTLTYLSMSLSSLHITWTRLRFYDIACDDLSKSLSIQHVFDVILNRFKKFDIAGKVVIKSKVCEIA